MWPMGIGESDWLPAFDDPTEWNFCVVSRGYQTDRLAEEEQQVLGGAQGLQPG